MAKSKAPAKAGPLSVAIYYETLCPDSVRFVVGQLIPTYTQLANYLDIDMIPYGKAIHFKNAQGKWEFDCQHGPKECLGNKLQACFLDQNIEFSVKMKIINCLMSSKDPSTAGEECARKFGIDYKPVHKCVNSEEGSEILANYGDITHNLNPKISFVPTIVFKGKYDQSLQNGALRNMLRTTCDLLQNQPEACRTRTQL